MNLQQQLVVSGLKQCPSIVFALVVGASTAAAEMDVDKTISAWPQKSQDAVSDMVKKYGQATEATEGMLKWKKNGPWKWTKVSNTPVAHVWPQPHVDLLTQAIDYRVPPDKFDDLARFDGSVVVDRTKGEMFATCEKEAANFLALNLAHEVVTEKRTVEDARREYEKQMAAFMKGEPAPYMEKLMFTPPQGGTADPDKEASK